MTALDAEQDAAQAAARARATVTEVDSVAGLREVAELFSRVWVTPQVPPMPHDIMRSLVHAGGQVHAALREGRLVGAAVGVFGPPAGASCYSLIAGVSPGTEGGGIGLALKLAQRVWALRAGAGRMVWTFDPLLRRNAMFNIARLGAVGTEYLVDFYGQVADGVNDPETDRLAVAWDLRAALPFPDALAGEEVPDTILAAGPGGEPIPGTVPPAGAGPGRFRCWIPEDMLALRRTDPALARRWRLALREALGGAIDGGYQVTGVLRAGWYILEKGRS